MAVSTCPRVFPSFHCRSDPDSSALPKPNFTGRRPRFSYQPAAPASYFFAGSSSLILRFPPNFVRQLSTKARRNCSNIGVAQIVAASWSNDAAAASPAPAGGKAHYKGVSKAFDAAASAAGSVTEPEVDLAGGDDVMDNVVDSDANGSVQNSSSANSFAGKPVSRPPAIFQLRWEHCNSCCIVSDTITTPVFNTSAYFFKKTADLIDFKEGGSVSFEYGRYGNYTTEAAEAKISALEGAETTLFLASGMCASTVMMLALIPAGGHIVTTTDCY